MRVVVYCCAAWVLGSCVPDARLSEPSDELRANPDNEIPETLGGYAGNNNTGGSTSSSGLPDASGVPSAGDRGGADAGSPPPLGSDGGNASEPPLPDPPGDAFFFDDFEAGAAGQEPARWNRWINYSSSAANSPTGNQFALIDDQDSFSGNKSVHFRTRQGSMPALLTLALPAQASRIHLRVRIKSSIQVGGVEPDTVSNHETLIGLRAIPNDGNFEIRFGGVKGALGFSMVGPDRNDAVAPPATLWGSPPALAANQWHCVEVEFDNTDPSSPIARASLDGTVVRGVEAVTDWHTNVTPRWLDDMFVEAIIGWQSFSPAPANDVWMDDVVLSNSPIGCN